MWIADGIVDEGRQPQQNKRDEVDAMRLAIPHSGHPRGP